MISADSRLLAGETVGALETLKTAAQAGFDALIWHHKETLFAEDAGDDLERAVTLAQEAGLKLVLKIDPACFPTNHPLVVSHPRAFRLHRSGVDHTPIDPRKPVAPSGEARARLHEREFAPLFEEPLRAALAELAGRGIGGFCIPRIDRIDLELLLNLSKAVRRKKRDTLLIGSELQSSSDADNLTSVVDYLTSSYSAWDGRASWWLDEAEQLRAGAPVINEIRIDSQRVSTQQLEPVMREAAALGHGLIVPFEFLERGKPVINAAAEAVELARVASGFDGAIRRLSSSVGPVTAFLRGDAPDLRRSEKALLLLANFNGQAEPLLSLDNLSAYAASFAPFVPFSAQQDVSAHLKPGEVRILSGQRSEPVKTSSTVGLKDSAAPAQRVIVDDLSPRVDGGNFAVKRVVGDRVTVEATIFTDGHEQLAAELRWRAADAQAWSTKRMEPLPNDRWRAEFVLERLGRHEFAVEGWLDRFAGFQRDFGKKVDAGVEQPVDHAEGRELVEKAVGRCKGKLKASLKAQHATLERADEQESARLLLSKELGGLMAQADERAHARASDPQAIDAERIEARFSSWYELFPRSMAPLDEQNDPARHGTFADVIEHLPRVRAMGFDTLYFPPIHPIGSVNRKGPNNTLTPDQGDPGSPYAIGSAEGGHDAIHPELGSFEDFDRLVAAAADYGLEIALDFAIQAAPDHPWLEEHPGWFAWRPDGSMKYAENPPKKYQDIVNVDFYGPDAVPGLWQALQDVVLLWVEHGVKTFRVDNPHTKPLPFWEWMIADVRAKHPDVIFLSEAFTRPTMMYQLAKVGFSQSYTYFTWRDRKHELIEYVTELTTEAPKEFYRPHFFVNTPDINPVFLQTGGRPAHLIRAVLAATLSGLWGVYSGFELCDATPLAPGKEEYLDSEKYQVRIRDWNSPGNIIDDISLLNRLRRANPALQTYLNTRFYHAWNDNVIWYGKPLIEADGTVREMIMVIVNLDPHHAHGCDFEIPLWEFLLSDDSSIAVEDLAAGHRFDWHGKTQHIELSPDEPYRIWRIAPKGGAA